jgi:hypothetical protein
VTDRSSVMTTVQLPMPLHAPLHPENVDPVAGVAANVTLAPAGYVFGQAGPGPHGKPSPETVPPPVPATTTLSVCIVGGAAAVVVLVAAVVVLVAVVVVLVVVVLLGTVRFVDVRVGTVHAAAFVNTLRRARCAETNCRRCRADLWFLSKAERREPIVFLNAASREALRACWARLQVLVWTLVAACPAAKPSMTTATDAAAASAGRNLIRRC